MIDAPVGLLRARNNSIPPRPMKCSGRLLPPGEWVEVDWQFFTAFGQHASLEFDFSGSEETLRLRNDAGQLTFDFWCPLSAVDGYGRHALAIWGALKELDCEPVIRSVDWADEKHLVRHIIDEARQNRERQPCRIGLCMSVPYDPKLVRHNSVYKIAITQFETDHIPAFHIKQVNQADHLIVTSKFQPPVWRASGLNSEIPISVMTPGVDADFFGYRERQSDVFRVLMLGALTGRKDPITAIRAFQDASRGAPDWLFTIKTRRTDLVPTVLTHLGFDLRYDLGDNGKQVAHIPYPFNQCSPADPRIRMVIADDTSEQVRDWYWSHDCLLWPSKGEGVGLPPLEAMSTGMDVVMSNNSGMADYAFPGHCWPIPTHHMEPADGLGGFARRYVETYGSVGNWWVPDYDVCVEQLASCHQAWKEGRGKGARAAQYVRDHHSLAHQGRSVLDVVREYE